MELNFFNEKGYKLNDEIEEEIENIILEDEDIPLRPIKGDIGKQYGNMMDIDIILNI